MLTYGEVLNGQLKVIEKAILIMEHIQFLKKPKI